MSSQPVRPVPEWILCKFQCPFNAPSRAGCSEARIYGCPFGHKNEEPPKERVRKVKSPNGDGVSEASTVTGQAEVASLAGATPTTPTAPPPSYFLRLPARACAYYLNGRCTYNVYQGGGSEFAQCATGYHHPIEYFTRYIEQELKVNQDKAPNASFNGSSTLASITSSGTQVNRAKVNETVQTTGQTEALTSTTHNTQAQKDRLVKKKKKKDKDKFNNWLKCILKYLDSFAYFFGTVAILLLFGAVVYIINLVISEHALN